MASAAGKVGFRWSTIYYRGVYSSSEWYRNAKPQILGKGKRAYIYGGSKFRIIGRAKAQVLTSRRSAE